MKLFIFPRTIHSFPLGNLGGAYLYIPLLFLNNVMNKKGVTSWLIWAILFLLVAIVAGAFGYGFVSGVSYTIAKWLAVIFVILFIVSVIAHTIKKA
jgi:uncharacterized membrane protein YtjA (UPF0391 family)